MRHSGAQNSARTQQARCWLSTSNGSRGSSTTTSSGPAATTASCCRGQVSSPDGVDPEAWRAEIRAQARRDKIRVLTSRDSDRAIAALNRATDDREIRDELERAHLLRQLATIARALGHEPGHWLRSDNESVCFCERCDARLYVHRQAAGQRRRGAV